VIKQVLWRWLDSLIPDDIKDFEQNEELSRARALVFILLSNALISLIATLTLFSSDLMPTHSSQFFGVGILSCLLGYAIALWVFKHSGNFTISGNIYALVGYLATLAGISVLSSLDALALMMALLALPLLVSLMAGVLSGLLWLGVIVMTPFMQILLGYSDSYSKFYLVSWGASCAGILISIYVGHYYREGIVSRLNSERTRFEFAAAHDALTGLSNRGTFDRRLRECIEYCSLHGTKAVLAYIDLDSFKPINDTLGHQAGDIVLITIADRLRHLVRKTDTVARLGGDEFAILFDQDCPSDLEPLLQRLNEMVAAPIDVFDNRLSVGCSVGVVVCPDDGLHPHQLAHKADERMYDAKRRNKAALFEARS
jgi:diguanylate cyclase (GGDEF)-like protein